MSYSFRQNLIDALIDDDGSFTVGTLFDRAWFQTLMADFNAGFFKNKTDAQPAVTVDADKQGLLFGLGGGSAPDTSLVRNAAQVLTARNAAGTAAANMAGADPTAGDHFVTRDYADSAYAPNPGATPIGGMSDWGSSLDPGVQADGAEWVLCDGRAISRATYSALNSLYSADSYPWGSGDGSTTFNLPDFRGWIPIGAGGTPALALGASAGDWDHVHALEQLPLHSHSIPILSGSTNAAGVHDHGGATVSAGSHNHTGTTGDAGAHDHGGATGAGGDHNHGGATGAGGEHNHGGATGLAGGHTHSGTALSSGAHRHIPETDGGSYPGGSGGENRLGTGTPIAGTQTTEDGAHTHNLSIVAVGDHNHTIAGSGTHTHTIAASGTHTHTIATQVAHNHTISTDGAHTHGINADGSHSHTVTTVANQTGTQGGPGARSEAANPPVLAVNKIIRIA